MPLDKVRGLIVFEMAAGTACFSEDGCSRRFDVSSDGMAVHTGRVGYALKQLNMTVTAITARRGVGRMHGPGQPQAVVGKHTATQQRGNRGVQ